MAEQSEFQGESLNVQLTTEPGCQVKFSVEVQPEATEKAYQQALKRVNKEVSLPGFRKGRAPIQMIEQKFAPHVEREFKDIVVQEALNDALKLTNVWPLNNDSLRPPKVDHCTREGGAEMTFEFESAPQVPDVNIDEIKVPLADAEAVSDEKVNEAIEELKDVYTEYEAVEDRGVQENDRVKIDIIKLGEQEESFAEAMPFTVADGKMAKWMQKLVLGKNVGDSVEGRSEFEGEHTSITEEEFEAIDVRITIQAIEAPKRPETEDDLVKVMNQENVEALRQNVRQDLEQRAQNIARAQTMSQLHEALLKEHNFDLPRSFLTMDQEARMHNIVAAMKESGLSDDQIKAQHAELQDKVAQDADRCIRLFFLLRPIAQKAKVDVTQQEMIREYSMQMYNVPVSDRIIHDQMDAEAIRTRLFIELLNHKTLDYLIQKSATAA